MKVAKMKMDSITHETWPFLLRRVGTDVLSLLCRHELDYVFWSGVGGLDENPATLIDECAGDFAYSSRVGGHEEFHWLR